jgi:hypothetical protein
MKTSGSRTAILTVLGSAVVSWSLFMVGIYTDLLVIDDYSDNGEWLGQTPAVSPSTYIFFAAISVFAIASVFAQRRAISQRIAAGVAERSSRAAHRFATLSIIIALAVAAILGISVFLEGFSGNREVMQPLSIRTLDTYLPIVLYTALLVSVLLAAFVFRSDTLPKSSDRVPDDAIDHEEPAGSGSQKDLGTAYAVPIVLTAVALIFGLIVYDVTGTSLDVWIWVLIQLVIASGIIVGTIFGERAVAQGPTSQSSRSRVTRAARGLNFVLSIVFGGVVTSMAFGYGGSAIDDLRSSPSFYFDIMAGPGAPLQDVDVSVNGWDLEEGSMVTIEIEEPLISLLSELVTDQDYFYETRPLPGNLEPGDYLLSAEATSVDGRVLLREIEFSVNADSEVYWELDQIDYRKLEQEDAVIISADASWFIRSFMPALVLLVIALTGVFFTLTERNREPRGLA